jgi:hypothetical protein
MTTTLIVATARMQPPTIGHKILADKVRELEIKHSSTGTSFGVILVSRACDHRDNPIELEKKMVYIRNSFPHVNFLPLNERVPSIASAIALQSGNYQNLIIVCGPDRYETFRDMVGRCSDKTFKFCNIDIVVVGDDKTRSDVSATRAREAALAEDEEEFARLVMLDGPMMRDMMKDIRKSLLHK